MGKTLFIEDLGDDVSEATLRELLSEHGTVESLQVVQDEDAAAGKPGRVAFAEMHSKREGRAAIAALNGREVGGRALTVKAMKQRSASSHGGPGGGGFHGGGRSSPFGGKGGVAGLKNRGRGDR